MFNKKQPSSFPFSEDEIRTKAYKVWKEQGIDRSPDENWTIAIEALKQERSLLGSIERPFRTIGQFWREATHKDNRTFSLDVVKTAISAFGVLATIFAGVGLYLTYQNSQRERELNTRRLEADTERLVTDRFGKAVEQLGSTDSSVRIGGIYALERLASDSPKDYWTTIEVLSAYVREHSSAPREKSAKKQGGSTRKLELSKLAIAIDVQSTIKVIGRRAAAKDPKDKQLDLSNSILSSELSRAQLSGAQFSRANLSNTGLSRANLSGANLSGVNLTNADLTGTGLSGGHLNNAILIGADLARADLAGADLTGTYLTDADLARADLTGADLTGAHLTRARLTDADLTGAHLNDDQLRDALLCRTTLSNGKISDRDCKKKNEQGNAATSLP